MGRRGIRLVTVVYLVIGLLVASTHGYLVAWNVPGNILEGLAAIAALAARCPLRSQSAYVDRLGLSSSKLSPLDR